MAKKQSMQAKVLAILKTGKELTTKQLTKVGLANPSACISQLRSSGAVIYANLRTNKTGTFTAYRMNVK